MIIHPIARNKGGIICFIIYPICIRLPSSLGQVHNAGIVFRLKNKDYFRSMQGVPCYYVILLVSRVRVLRRPVFAAAAACRSILNIEASVIFFMLQYSTICAKGPWPAASRFCGGDGRGGGGVQEHIKY